MNGRMPRTVAPEGMLVKRVKGPVAATGSGARKTCGAPAVLFSPSLSLPASGIVPSGRKFRNEANTTDAGLQGGVIISERRKVQNIPRSTSGANLSESVEADVVNKRHINLLDRTIGFRIIRQRFKCDQVAVATDPAAETENVYRSAGGVCFCLRYLARHGSSAGRSVNAGEINLCVTVRIAGRAAQLKYSRSK